MTDNTIENDEPLGEAGMSALRSERKARRIAESERQRLRAELADAKAEILHLEEFISWMTVRNTK